MGDETKPNEQNPRGDQGADIKCLAECPRCQDEGTTGMCGFDSGHTSAHRCNRCSNVWE
jgi:hypothetical protein